MVEVIISRRADHVGYGGGQPIIHVHGIRREVFGNEVAIWVAGEIKIAAKEVVFAKELLLNTLQVLVLTPEHGVHYPFWVSKWIYHKGEYGNYASIDIYESSLEGTIHVYEMLSSGRLQEAVTAPSTLPSDGSLWLDFFALGE